MAVPVILIEARPRRASDGTPVTVRLAGGGALFPYRYRAQSWKAGIVAVPNSVAKLDFDGLQLGGGGIPNAIEVEWAPIGNAALAKLSSLYWTDAPISVWIGPEGEAMPPLEAAGLVLTSPIARGSMSIGLADAAVDLKRPILVDRFKGTGGLEGPVEFEGQIKTRAWGRCWNVPGKVIDAAANIWCFGDPLRQWRAIDAVRDVGVPADPAALVQLAWQGSAEQTLAALKAAQAPQGGGVLCPSIACVKWWTQLTGGDLHIDLRGEIDGGYVETAPEIAARIVAARSALSFGVDELVNAVAARPEPFGWRCATESITAASAVTEVLGDVGLSWVLVAGEIVFRPWEWSQPRRRAVSESVTRQELIKPVGTRKLGYRRNQAPMARGDLGAFVLGTDVLFDDGSNAADLSAQFARIVSNGWLDRGEKPAIKREWDALNALLDATEGQWVAIGSPADVSTARDAARGSVQSLTDLLGDLRPAWDDPTLDTPIDGAAFNAAWSDARAKVEVYASALRGRPGRDAPLVRTQWSINGVDGWHDDYFGADVYQRQSADNGVTWGPALRVIGESGNEGVDGISPSIVFTRSPTIPATPTDNTGNPPTGWNDGPPEGTDFLWQSTARFRGEAQLSSWSPPARISGADGTSPITLDQNISALYVSADYLGTVFDGQFPRTSKFTMREGTTDVSGATTWSIATANCTASIDGSGLLSVTAATNDGYVDVTGTYKGSAQPRRITITLNRGAPPPQTPTQQSAQLNSTAPGATTFTQVGSLSITSDEAGYIRGTAGASVRVPIPNQTNATRFYISEVKLAYRRAGTQDAFSDFSAGVVQLDQAYARGYPEPDQIDADLNINQTQATGTSKELIELVLLMRKTSGTAQSAQLVNGSLVGQAGQ